MRQVLPAQAVNAVSLQHCQALVPMVHPQPTICQDACWCHYLCHRLAPPATCLCGTTTPLAGCHL
jgi:hypothetical protein